MKKIKFNKKAAFFAGLSVLGVTAISVPAVLLTSCSATSNNYGPYTIITNSANNTPSNTPINNGFALEYDTQKQEYMIFNKDGKIIPESYNKGAVNQWISSAQVLQYYRHLANQQVVATLSNETNANNIWKNNYGGTIPNENTQGKTSTTEKWVNPLTTSQYTSLNFMYGVQPTELMNKIAYLYNYMTIQGNVFKLASALATELLSYGVNGEFSSMYNWLANNMPQESNPLAPATSSVQPGGVQTQNVTQVVGQAQQVANAKDYAKNSVIQWGSQIKDNSAAKEMSLGFGTPMGQGQDTYHLWPSGFNATYKVIPNSSSSTGNGNTNTGGTNNGGSSAPATRAAAGTSTDSNWKDVTNKPYPLVGPGSVATLPKQENSNSKESTQQVLPQAPAQYTLEVSNITINYQWYKAKKTGGSYVTAQDMNPNLSQEQKVMLSHTGYGEPYEIHNASYTLPISNLQFNIIPMTSSYTDPVQNALTDYVYNGIYSIQPKLKFNGSTNCVGNLKYPTALQSKGDVSGVNWRALRATSNNAFSNDVYKNGLSNEAYTEIQTELNGQNNLAYVPFYANNAQAWTADTTYQAAYSVPNKLNSYQTKYMTDIFANIFANTGIPVADRDYYNNQNNLNQLFLLNFWCLGWMHKNVNNSSEYKGPNNQVPSSDRTNNGETKLCNNMDPKKTFEFDSIRTQLKKVGFSKYVNDTKNSDVINTVKEGVKVFYNIIQPSKIASGVIYNFDKGMVTSTSGAVNTTPIKPGQPATVTPNNKQEK